MRNYGYSRRGQRAEVGRNAVRVERCSAIAGLALSGLHCLGLLRGSVDGQEFVAYVQNVLVPVLNPFNGRNPHSVVIMGKCLLHGLMYTNLMTHITSMHILLASILIT